MMTEFGKNDTQIKKKEIKEKFSNYFAAEITEDMRLELRDIIGNQKIINQFVHPRCPRQSSNSFLGVFLQFFVKKTIFNLQSKNSYNSYIEFYASIFPFKVNPKPTLLNQLEVMDLYDKNFKETIQVFLNSQFDDPQPFSEIVPRFLSNIEAFMKENFDGDQLKIFHNKGVELHHLVPMENAYLKTFPRLNEKGAQRYLQLYESYKYFAKLFNRYNMSEKDLNYFLTLPEKNFSDLYSLLNVDIFQNQRDHYINNFKKFMFFYVRAEKSKTKTTFFIDDALFECLKSYQNFRKSHESPTSSDLLYDLSMLTLVYRRKQNHDSRKDDFDIFGDVSHLECIKKYIENFPGIQEAIIDYEKDSDILTSFIPINLKKSSLDINFSGKQRNKIEGFFKHFISAAFCEYPIKKLHEYNGFRGVLSSVDMIPDTGKEKIKNFVKKYNQWNNLMRQPLEVKNLTWGLEEFFCEGTINWDQKNGNQLILNKDTTEE